MWGVWRCLVRRRDPGEGPLLMGERRGSWINPDPTYGMDTDDEELSKEKTKYVFVCICVHVFVRLKILTRSGWLAKCFSMRFYTSIVSHIEMHDVL